MSDESNNDHSITTHAPSVVQVETSKLVPLLIVIAILCGMAITFSFIGFVMLRDRMSDTETEARLMQYYVSGLDATLIAKGIKQQGDDYEAYKQKHLKEQHR